MKVSIHQPNFLPWIGFFSKIYKSDKFIFLNDAYVHKKNLDYLNRSLFLSNDKNKYFSIPVKKNFQTQKILNLEIDNTKEWKKDFLNFIHSNYNVCEFFKDGYSIISSIKNKDFKFLIDLNIFLIIKLFKKLNIKKNIYFSSEFKINSKSTQRIIDLVKIAKGQIYLTGTGANNYLDKNEFIKNKIKLELNQINHPIYVQKNLKSFTPGLSIIDIIMNCGLKKTEKFIKCK
tara:strand:- start:265 stop:957 length:693 start_codon:yes stop_codon:yes gene_type:complete